MSMGLSVCRTASEKCLKLVFLFFKFVSGVWVTLDQTRKYYKLQTIKYRSLCFMTTRNGPNKPDQRKRREKYTKESTGLRDIKPMIFLGQIILLCASILCIIRHVVGMVPTVTKDINSALHLTAKYIYKYYPMFSRVSKSSLHKPTLY